MKKKDKIKFKDRPAVQWIKDKAPDLVGNSLEFIGDVTGIEALEKLGEKISGINDAKTLSPEQQAYAMELIKQEIEAEKEITARWSSDMSSDNFLSKIARPVILFYSWVLVTVIVILDFCGVHLISPLMYMIEALALTVTGGYFTLRTVEKRNQKKYLSNE